MQYDAVVFDLLTALLDSWALWNRVAGSEEQGYRWRRKYLELTYQCGGYVPYEGVIRDAARRTGADGSKADELISRWNELEPWPEAREVLSILSRKVPLGVVTNSSNARARIAVAQVKGAFAPWLRRRMRAITSRVRSLTG